MLATVSCTIPPRDWFWFIIIGLRSEPMSFRERFCAKGGLKFGTEADNPILFGLPSSITLPSISLCSLLFIMTSSAGVLGCAGLFVSEFWLLRGFLVLLAFLACGTAWILPHRNSSPLINEGCRYTMALPVAPLYPLLKPHRLNLR